MSNVIKAYSVNYDGRAKKYIDTHLKDIAIEKRLEQEIKKANPQPRDGFVEGIKAPVIEPQEDKKLLADNIVREAQKKADSIIEQAKKEALKIKNETYTEAQKKGYEEGMRKAGQEIKKLEAEYAQKMQGIENERENTINELQEQIAQIIAGLVEKITGIVIQDKDDVILYLVEKALKNLDKCNEFNIKVSGEDYNFISDRRELLQQALDREVAIHITEDPALHKNECMIETDNRVINCSLDTQLDNLITDIKLIGGI